MAPAGYGALEIIVIIRGWVITRYGKARWFRWEESGHGGNMELSLYKTRNRIDRTMEPGEKLVRAELRIEETKQGESRDGK